MNDQNYTTSIEVSKSPQEVFNHLKEVSKWWSKDFEGASAQLNDEFVIHHPNQHYSKQKLVEVIPDKKIIWLVTNSTLNWLQKDQHEWTNTKMIFVLSPGSDPVKTVIHFTHEGLVPQKECYAMCQKGWNRVIGDFLFHYITQGKTI